MSIKNADDRERQERQIAGRRSKEAQARPDAVHRAVHFLLQQTALNNRDTTPEVNYHIETLDRELANPEALEEVNQIPAAVSAEEPPPAPAPAAPIKVSRRFRRSAT
jgi:hypothetical protein